jgi:hypothetical protein
MAASAGLIRGIYRGELDLGRSRAATTRRARMPLSGAVGALMEKDLRIAWRDPASKAGLVIALTGPLLRSFFLSAGAIPGALERLRRSCFFSRPSSEFSAFGGQRAGPREARDLAALRLSPSRGGASSWAENLGRSLLAPPEPADAPAGRAVSSAPWRACPRPCASPLATLLISAGVDNYMSIPSFR